MLNKIKILLVDDNDQDLKIMKRYLERAGFEQIAMAKNSREAVMRFEEMYPDVVICDTILPGEDGFEVCSNLKKMNAESKVIVTTGFIDAVDAGKAREAGADDYVVKSADCDPLVEAVRRLVG